jgi:CheY-like chemotaxis protein
MSQPSEPAGSDGPTAIAEPAAFAPVRPLALLVDFEPSLAMLMAAWLDDIGVEACTDAPPATTARGIDLVVVDVPYPRREGPQRVRALADALPAAPILALSPTFFAGVATSGSVARDLGAACVLATPVRRDALVTAVRRLLPAPR